MSGFHTVRLEHSESSAERRDANVRRRMRTILGSDGAVGSAKVVSQCPFSLGGLGLTSAARPRVAAHSSSWADFIHLITRQLPPVVETLIMGRGRPGNPVVEERERRHLPGRWMPNPQHPSLVGSPARQDAWKSNISGCRCGQLSENKVCLWWSEWSSASFVCLLVFVCVRRSKGGLATCRKRDGHSRKDGRVGRES